MRIVAVIVLASLLASVTDWLCMDVLVHRFYARDPATWRRSEGGARIVLSQLIAAAATAATVALCAVAPGRPFAVAALVWAAGAGPVVLQNLQWIRMSPAVAAGHAAGWAARLAIAACLAAAR
jgi:hypothetical protein